MLKHAQLHLNLLLEIALPKCSNGGYLIDCDDISIDVFLFGVNDLIISNFCCVPSKGRENQRKCCFFCLFSQR